MGGGWQTYRCDRCPLTLVLGGAAWWDEAGTVYARQAQVACAACGTLHRVTADTGGCRVDALPGPLRVARTEVLRDMAGVDHEVAFWVAEGDWQPGGPHPDGLAALDRLPCRHCGQADGMLTLSGFKLPFEVARAGGREACPVCRGPVNCIAVSDAI